MIIFDEYKHAEEMLKSGFQTSKSNKFELQILSTYFREQGMKDKEIEENLKRFCKNFMNNYNEVNCYELIDQKVRKSRKYKLKKASLITVTKAELETISREENLKVRKLMFVYLVLAKYYMSNNHTAKYYVGIEDNEIYKLCDMYMRKQEKLDFMHYLTKKGYIKPTMNMSSIVNYVNEDSEPVITLIPDSDMVYYYEQYLGDLFINCSVCGCLVKKRSNNTKYCSKCSSKIKNGSIKT